MVNLIGNTNIGDLLNKQILNPIKEANGLNDFPDFNDENKLGKGKDLVDTVSNLIRIFNDNALDFSGNSAEGDDILGDAYEYLMRHFASESGKSKGQFYTPAEVSRILAKVIGISAANSTTQTTAYDPTCGSGSLLLKVMNEAGKGIDLYGQEKETATANLAHMNMILHGAETATISADNTLTRPAYKEADGSLKRFDYIVANPPFSLKSWSNGVNVDSDEFDRFELGVPPEKNGDYAFLLHMLKSLKSNGKAAVVLPHGVLFRGNAEGEIRKNILKKGYIKGIIGLPANLFYGTGIPACIIVLDKENAAQRKGIFMIDAGKGFIKDGNKNRLREQDIRKITDVFHAFAEIPKYSRMVPVSEIADTKNDYNLNIPRYIDTQESEDLQNIEAHLMGGIPESDIEDLQRYWKLFPNLETDLFAPLRPDFLQLKHPVSELKNFIFSHPEFLAFKAGLREQFDSWFRKESAEWEKIDKGTHPKTLIEQAGERILKIFEGHSLIDNYDLYQHLMQYWNEAMQDDVYTVSIDGWEAGKQWQRLMLKGKKGKDGKVAKDKEIAGLAGVEGRMIAPALLIAVYFKAEQDKISTAEQQIEQLQARMSEIEEEQSGDEGLFGELEKINAGEVSKLLKAKKQQKHSSDEELAAEIALLEEYLDAADAIKKTNALIKSEAEKLEALVLAEYKKLSIDDVKKLVIVDKWQRKLLEGLEQEQERQSRALTQRIRELAERYAVTLLELDADVENKKAKVLGHLRTMGFL